MNSLGKIEIYVICYNESFLLPFFVEHYRKQFDDPKIIVYDNMSSDNTADLAKILGCEVREFNTNQQFSDLEHLKIKLNCWKGSKADWVIIVDADEFLFVNFDPGQATIIKSNGFQMVGPPSSTEGVPDKMYSKTVMFRPNKITQMNYPPGCHVCKPEGRVVYPSNKALLAHRKYISPEYVFQRHSAAEKRLSPDNRKYGWGIQYINTSLDKEYEIYMQLKNKAKNIFH